MSTRKARQPGTGAGIEQATIFVVVPTYNEATNLRPLAKELVSLPIPHLQVVIVDDNSPDGTGQVAEELRESYPGRIHVIHRAGKLGLGAAYRAGFAYSLEHGADFVVQMDADFSHSPRYIPEFLQRAADFDVVVGSRYAEGGELDPRWGKGRYQLSRWANSVYVRLLLGIHVNDATGGFKLWSRAALTSVLSREPQSKGYVFQVEMAYLSELLGWRVTEMPIFFQERMSGVSKMSLGIKLEAAWRTALLWWKYRHLRLHGADGSRPAAPSGEALRPAPSSVNLSELEPLAVEYNR